MQDREFEKQVNQKMQELRFAPDPEVWARVQADLQKKKKRRPVIIWFILAGLILGGSGLWLTGNWKEKKQTNGSSVQHKPGVIEKTEQTKQQIAVTKEKEIAVNTTDQPLSTVQSTPEIQKTHIAQKEPAKQGIATNQQAGIAMENKPAKQEKQNQEEKIQEKKTQEKQDQAQPNQEKKTQQKKNKSSWQFGITAGAGISDVGRQLLQGSRVADFAYSSNSNVTPNYNPRPSSEVNASAAVQLGAYVSKGLGKRFGVKLGLNYEYYSTSISVGTLYNVPRAVNQGSTMKMVDEFYTTGTNSKYTNKYHFVSLPVSLQLKLADRKKYGIVWENGIMASRLISATALHYDGITGTYYKDDALFNKTQWTASSSLLFNIKSKSLQMYAGPHVQYGLSNLVNGSESHLRYAGLKLMVGFNKK